MKNTKFFLSFIIFSLFINPFLIGQEISIDYYGIVSKSIDDNMAKMTSDLYYTQLVEIQSFNITDCRIKATQEEYPDSSTFADNKLSFYVEIIKNPSSDNWTTKLFVYNKENSSIKSTSKNYDSFYKILVESKENLKETIKSLINNSSVYVENDAQEDNIFNNTQKTISSEILSGNWSGEEFIDKIIIMRGGRGFVILKNGASINISISINNSDINISQTGKTNASYFPEIPRSEALRAALTAAPITWNLHYLDDNTLSGVKNTLIYKDGVCSQGNIQVTWKRLN